MNTIKLNINKYNKDINHYHNNDFYTELFLINTFR